VRASLDNWSDTELGALAVGMHKAGEACAKLKPSDFKGDDVYDLARLCTFGQGWNEANTAALDYVASRAEEHRTQAYALSVNALVHLNALDLAVKTAHEMLFRLPYDAEVAYALRGLKEFLEESSKPTAAVAADEHPMIVAALAQGVPLKATHGNAEMSIGALYESAMRLAFLDRYDGDKRSADAAAADVKSALPATAVLTAEDRMLIDVVSTRYQLLGARLPEVKVTRSLQSDYAKGSAKAEGIKAQGIKAQIDPHFGAATVLVLFPDWCVQCRRMMKTLTQFAAANRDTPIHAYGLVFADDAVVLGQAAHEENLKEMRGTQTLVVPAATAQSFGATDFPLGIVLDRTGTIRFIDAIPGNAFDGDSYIGKVIVRMVRAAGGTLKNPEKAK
jgi:thiol-disulfide isomerase/thioredoxin